MSEEKKEEITSYLKEVAEANKQITEYLAKKNQYTIQFEDGQTKTYDRKPMSTKKNKEIDKLRNGYKYFDQNKIPFPVGDKKYTDRTDILYDLYEVQAKHSLNMSEDDYNNAIWEDDESLIEKDVFGLKSVLDGCVLRTVGGVAKFRSKP